MLVFKIGESLDAALFFLQKLVEKVDKQVFIIFFTEQFLETEISEGVQIGGRLHADTSQKFFRAGSV